MRSNSRDTAPRFLDLSAEAQAVTTTTALSGQTGSLFHGAEHQEPGISWSVEISALCAIQCPGDHVVRVSACAHPLADVKWLSFVRYLHIFAP